jgi:hypothetical protein
MIISQTSDELVTFLKLFIAGTTRQNKASTVLPYFITIRNVFRVSFVRYDEAPFFDARSCELSGHTVEC